jgi:hypothetical protein
MKDTIRRQITTSQCCREMISKQCVSQVKSQQQHNVANEGGEMEKRR